MIESRIIQPDDTNYPKDAIHICAENENQAMLDSIDNSIHYIKASDNLPKKVSVEKVNKVLNQNQSENGGLAGILES